MDSFDKLLEESVKVHGHLCPGQVIGVRLALLGLKTVGFMANKVEPEHLFTVVELDRCPTDAIKYVTGCTVANKSFKLVDYGEMAASFVNTYTGKACRVLEKTGARDSASKYYPKLLDKKECQIAAYKIMKDHELFTVQTVVVEFPKADMPNNYEKEVCCQECGVWVQVHGDIVTDTLEKCKSCLGEKYYTVVD